MADLYATIDLTVDEAVRPSLDDVGALVRSRTRSNQTGRATGTFSSQTNPTAEDVNSFIDDALDYVRLRLPDQLPARLENFVRRLVARRAAMDVELTLDQEKSSAADSAYARHKELFDAGMAVLVDTTADEGLEITPRSGSARLRCTIVDELVDARLGELL